MAGLYVGYFFEGKMEGKRILFSKDGSVRRGLCKDNHWVGDVKVKTTDKDKSKKKEIESYGEDGRRITELNRNIEAA
jgi:hypothetical protein